MAATAGCPWQPTLSYISHIFGSTFPLSTLSFCSQPYASIYRHLWCCSTCSFVNNGGHRLQLIQQWWLPIVNGWCQPFAAHAMATTQQMQDLYLRATLDYDGVLRQYAYRKTAASGSRNRAMDWTTLPSFVPSNICMRISGQVGSGASGFNSYCRLGDDQRPSCLCPPGYTFFDPNDERKGCKKNFISQDCDRPSQEIDSFEIKEMPNTDWPGNGYEDFVSVHEECWCQQACLHDCYCAAAIFNNGDCLKKRSNSSLKWENRSKHWWKGFDKSKERQLHYRFKLEEE